MPEFVVLALCGAVILAGAAVQGAAGFGMNMLAAPLLALLEPALVPVPMLVAAALLAGMTFLRERRAVVWGEVGYTLAGRIPGNLLGLAAVALLPRREFSLLLGVLMLGCVLLSVISWRPRPTPVSLTLAGMAGGMSGTSSSIGGPPVALVYQNSAGPRIRATLSAYFALGTVLSLLTLALAGQIGPRQLWATAFVLPFLVAGFALSGPARRVLDAGRMRRAVLGLSAASAVLVIVHSLT